MSYSGSCGYECAVNSASYSSGSSYSALEKTVESYSSSSDYSDSISYMAAETAMPVQMYENGFFGFDAYDKPYHSKE